MNRFIIPHATEIPAADNEDAHNALPQTWFDYSTVPLSPLPLLAPNHSDCRCRV